MEFSQIITLIKTVSESSLKEFEMKNQDIKLYMKQGTNGASSHQVRIVPQIEPTETVLAVKEEPEGKIVCSPLVGTFYRAPEEDAPPFVKVGDQIKKGQVLGIVEAMKLMNEIESDVEGRVEEIFPENGEAVEYGQPLFRVI